MSDLPRIAPSRKIYTCLRHVDVSGYEAIVDHPRVLPLMEKTQLACAYKVFPGARQSRYEHSIINYHFTDKLCECLLKKKCISKNQANDLRINALVHDVGHAPFSHFIGRLLGYVIDPDNPTTHNDRGVKLLKESEEKDSSGRTIRDAIKECGGNFRKVVGIMAKEAPESCINSHHTLGVDKISYTLGDCQHTGYLLEWPYFLDLFDWYIYKNEEVGICLPEGEEDEMMSQVMRLQNMLQEMYRNVYLHKDVKQYERFIEKAVELEIDSDLTPEMVWNMSEGALLFRLRNSNNSEVRELLKTYSRNELYEPVMEFKIKERGNVAKNSEKIQEFVNRNISDAFIKKYRNTLNLTKLERKISDAIGIPFVDLSITLSADPQRIMPEDTALYTPYGKKIVMLFKKRPDHYNSLVENAENFFALRIHVKSNLKNGFLSESEIVKEIIEGDVKKSKS